MNESLNPKGQLKDLNAGWNMKPLVLLIALFVIGCKSGGGDSITSDSFTKVKNGVYQTCSNDPDYNYSIRDAVLITDSYVQNILTYHEGHGCTGAEITDLKINFSYRSLGNHNYRLSVESFNTTVFNTLMEDEYEDMQYCGIVDWPVGISVNLIGLDCDDSVVQRGEEQDFKVGMIGSKLKIVSEGETSTYGSLNGMNFENSSQSMQNGKYVSYDGSIGIYLTVNKPNYTATFYDQSQKKYFTISGDMNFTGNEGVFSVDTDVCHYDSSETFTMKFAQLSKSLALREAGESDLLLEKIDFTQLNFESAYLETGYSAGCPL